MSWLFLLPPQELFPIVRVHADQWHARVLYVVKKTQQDCNQCGQALDQRLEELGAKRLYARGEADERTGLTEVEPWILGLWDALAAA